MTKDERIAKRPSTKAKRQALMDARVFEALEREASLGVEHPEHLKAIHKKLKEAKA
jgi:fido (protein-threonine AMPylation protein)